MRWLFLLLVLFTVTAQAETAWYYNPDETGHGIVLSELDDGRLAFAFYSQVEDVIPDIPVISPAPPPPLFCDEDNIWLIGLSDLYLDGLAIGDVYYAKKLPSFPVAVNGQVSESHIVGEFIVYAEGDGFVLRIENNHTICNLSVFGVDHYFTTKLAD